MFIQCLGYKGSRKRTWNKIKTEIDDSILECKALELCESLNKPFDISLVSCIYKYLFHIPKNSIIKLRDYYFKLVFSDYFKNDVTFYQLHYIFCDLFMYKIEPFVVSNVVSKTKSKTRCVCSLDFINKGTYGYD